MVPLEPQDLVISIASIFLARLSLVSVLSRDNLRDETRASINNKVETCLCSFPWYIKRKNKRKTFKMSSLPPALNFAEMEEDIVKKWKEEDATPYEEGLTGPVFLSDPFY